METKPNLHIHKAGHIEHPEKSDSTIKPVSNKNKCDTCVAKCCQYVATQLDSPDNKEDLDDVRWYLVHNIWVFFEENEDGEREWYLQINNPCMYLGKDHKCTVYDIRPTICRKYSHEECEHENTDEDDSVMFKTMEEFDEYLRTHTFEEVIGKPANK